MNSVTVQSIDAQWLTDQHIRLEVLRLDNIHPVVSGNKWFKLKYYLQNAVLSDHDTIATFGGPWSNHVVAVACASKERGLKSVGIIRGEKPPVLSTTLQTASAYGMKFIFTSREEYRNKESIKNRYTSFNWYWINEGGYGAAGVKGASEILTLTDSLHYTHIIAAVGTGTMLAGLLLSAQPKQKVIGINSMKGNVGVEKDILDITGERKPEAGLQLMHDYHFGGYGKHPRNLIDFINEVYLTHNLPLDIVYTAKTFFAIKDLAIKNFFKPGSVLLMIHSGGLQGNNSLPAEVLAF